MDIRAEVRSFIIGNFFVPSGGLKDDEPLLETGVIDSTGVLELIQFVEEKYGAKLEDEEILPENLGSVERIAEFVGRKLSVGGRLVAEPAHE